MMTTPIFRPSGPAHRLFQGPPAESKVLAVSPGFQARCGMVTLAFPTLPAALVGNGYQIRVGAHSWDHSNRPTLKRPDRSSRLYSINVTMTKIASPLGGGIYIEVPKGRSAGVVNVTVTGAACSPFFSAKSFHQTTLSEWQTTERTQPGPWADFQSEKFMFQVPRSWIYAFADPVTLMQNWDKAMDATNDLMGFPQVRGKETMYDQVDVQLRSAVYAPGYPACNASYNPSTVYTGNQSHYLLTGLTHTAWTSTNLSNWTRDTGATQTVNSTANNVQTVTVKLSNALLTQPKLFVRVQAAN